MKTGLRTILYILLFLSCFSCKRQEGSKTFNILEYGLKINRLNDSVVADPLKMSEVLDSLICKERDSFSYYGMLVVQAKVKMFLAKNDDSDILLHKVEAYCERNKELMHIDYLRMLMLNARGNLLCRQAAFDSAVSVFSEACSICQKIGDKSL